MATLGPDQPKRPRDIGRLDDLFKDLLGGVPTHKPAPAPEADLAKQVSTAVQSLDEVKQVIVNHLYGLRGQALLSHAQIASLLTASLSPALRASLAADLGIEPGQVVFSESRVKELEAEALRDLRSGPARG